MSADVPNPSRPATFAVGYLAAYFLSSVLPTPLPWYYPLAHRFAFQVHASGVASDFQGRVLLSLAVGALAAAGVRPRWFGERARRLFPGWIASLLLFSAGLYLFALTHRLVIPAPLPPGYVAR